MMLQGVEFSIFLLTFAWASQQCSATALSVIQNVHFLENIANIKNVKNIMICSLLNSKKSI